MGARRELVAWRFVACFALSLLVYVPRAYRTLCLMGDSAEMVTAAALGGIPHAPGYPLYVVLGRALRWLPFGELPFRIHLGSAILHAATVAVVALAIEQITRRTGPAMLGAATLALSRVFLAGSLYAEVFPLNDLLFALLLLLAARVADDVSDGRTWIALSMATGMALSHHQMIALGAPALLLLVGPGASRVASRHPLRAAGLLLVTMLIPVASYSLLLIAAARDPLLSWGDVHDFHSLYRLITRQDYGGLLHASRRPASGQLLERLDAFALSTGESFGIVALALSALGVVWGYRHARRPCAALVLAFVCAGPLFAGTNAVDLHSEYRRAFFERFASMSHVPLAILVGMGATEAFDRIRSSPRWSRGLRASMVSGLLVVLTVVPLVFGTRDLDFSRDDLGAVYAHDLVASLPEGSLVLLKGDMSTQAALYACGVERRCGDRIVMAPLQLGLPWKLEQERRRHPSLFATEDNAFDYSSGDGVAKLVRHELARRPVAIHGE
ncbi:MAG TPA: DUF2723 domain-containing protein, partial [Polyangiaceae bacterium]